MITQSGSAPHSDTTFSLAASQLFQTSMVYRSKQELDPHAMEKGGVDSLDLDQGDETLATDTMKATAPTQQLTVEIRASLLCIYK